MNSVGKWVFIIPRDTIKYMSRFSFIVIPSRPRISISYSLKWPHRKPCDTRSSRPEPLIEPRSLRDCSASEPTQQVNRRATRAKRAVPSGTAGRTATVSTFAEEDPLCPAPGEPRRHRRAQSAGPGGSIRRAREDLHGTQTAAPPTRVRHESSTVEGTTAPRGLRHEQDVEPSWRARVGGSPRARANWALQTGRASQRAPRGACAPARRPARGAWRRSSRWRASTRSWRLPPRCARFPSPRRSPLGGDIDFDVQHEPRLPDDLDRRIGFRQIVDDVHRGDLRERRQIGREMQRAGADRPRPAAARAARATAPSRCAARGRRRPAPSSAPCRAPRSDRRYRNSPWETAAARSSRPTCRRAAPPSARALP